jgi:dTMP kinase
MNKYVVFDGMDGSGKGTQMKLLEEKFASSVVFTREPGGTLFAEEIRKLVRDNPLAGKSTALNNFLLFWAAREELQHNLVVPSLQAGKHVFSDRGDSSTFAFQLWGEDHRELLDIFLYLQGLVFDMKGRHSPDLYIVFDLSADVARERALQDASRTPNHFDVRPLEYYERVREGFQHFVKYVPSGALVMIDATRSIEEIQEHVLAVLADRKIIPVNQV